MIGDTGSSFLHVPCLELSADSEDDSKLPSQSIRHGRARTEGCEPKQDALFKPHTPIVNGTICAL